MMMMIIMIAGFVDSITTPIKSWIDTLVNRDDDRHKTAGMAVKQVGIDSSRVDCIVCLSEVTFGERFAMLERCRHGFHVECLEAWLKDHPNCPLCRASVFGDREDHTRKHRVYLKKSYEIVSDFGFRVIESVACWLTNSFSKGLQSSLSDSCKCL